MTTAWNETELMVGFWSRLMSFNLFWPSSKLQHPCAGVDQSDSLGHKKKKKKRENPVLRALQTQIFHFGRFFLSLLKSCNISCFWPKSKKKKKLAENFGKLLRMFFQKKHVLIWWDFCVFKGVIFATREKKKCIKGKKCPDRLTLLGRPVCP